MRASTATRSTLPELFWQFVTAWTLLGVGAVFVRPCPIWQEKQRGYRVGLVILIAPAAFAIILITALINGVVGHVRYTRSSIEGVSPEEEE